MESFWKLEVFNKQLWLVTMIREDSATFNKDFIKNKQHHVFDGGVNCYNLRHLSSYKPNVRLLHIAML